MKAPVDQRLKAAMNAAVARAFRNRAKALRAKGVIDSGELICHVASESEKILDSDLTVNEAAAALFVTADVKDLLAFAADWDHLDGNLDLVALK